MRWGIRDYWYSHKKTEEKQRLVRALGQFDSLSNYKPIFFAYIHAKFGGSIEKYVDHLFAKSMFTRPWKMETFCRRPTAKKLQSDPGVQFVIGLALYDLWIQKVRNGEITEEADSLAEAAACE